MLRSLCVLLDYPIAATDVHTGIGRGFSFRRRELDRALSGGPDSQSAGPEEGSAVAFLVIGELDWQKKRLRVSLTSEQIRTSPPLECDMPVAVQRESGRVRPKTHLRSIREVLGYSVRTKDGDVGLVGDFIIEDTLWGVQYVVVELKQSPQRSILVPPEAIRSISWSAKAALVDASIEDLEKSPELDAVER